MFCDALVLWFVVAPGLTVTLLCGMALKLEFVFTDVLALGFVDWLAPVLVLLPARLSLRPFMFAFPPVPPAWVLLVVPVFCVVDVLWLVVPLGLMVTLLCGIALKLESVLTDVLALGFVDWMAFVFVSLVAELLFVCATAEPPATANAAAAMNANLFRIMIVSLVKKHIKLTSVDRRPLTMPREMTSELCNKPLFLGSVDYLLSSIRNRLE